MKLTILGQWSPYPPAGGATPGYLVEGPGGAVLVECGSGAVSRLQRHLAISDLQAVVISHLHGDHMADMLVMRYAVDVEMGLGRRTKPLHVYAPPEPPELHGALGYRNAVVAAPITEADTLDVAGLKVSFARTEHPLLCYAMSMEAAGKKLAYSADTAYSAAVAALVRGADLFLCEATGAASQTGGQVPGHLTGREAGALAREAGVKRLVLTHYPPVGDASCILEEAREAFGGEVELAAEGRCYEA